MKMDTPRRGLIRATERAIGEYIRDGCEENLPMIRQLEDVAYQFWVESNTSFLNETVETVEEDEGWMWDEDCLLQSFSAHVEDCLQDDKCTIGNVQDEADDTSSICSSIKPCDETDCSLGYLASCEESFNAHTSMHLPSPEAAPRVEEFVEQLDKEKMTTKPDHDFYEYDCSNSSKCGTNISQRVCISDLTQHDSGVVSSESVNFDSAKVFNAIPEQEDVVTVEDDEWVVVGEDYSETVSNNEWFIVSTVETRGCEAVDSFCVNTRTAHLVNGELVYGSVDKVGNSKKENTRAKFIENCESSKDLITINQKDRTTNEDTDCFDLSDWAVLSVKVTEMLEEDKKTTHKVTGLQTTRQSDYMWKKDTSEHQFNSSYGMSSLGNCPLCKSKDETYKCAIVCVIMQR